MPTGVVTSPDLEIWAGNPLTMPRSATAALSEDLRLGGSSKPPGLFGEKLGLPQSPGWVLLAPILEKAVCSLGGPRMQTESLRSIPQQV